MRRGREVGAEKRAGSARPGRGAGVFERSFGSTFELEKPRLRFILSGLHGYFVMFHVEHFSELFHEEHSLAGLDMLDDFARMRLNCFCKLPF